MPRPRSAAANGPSPSRTNAVSSFDSATCTAIGSRSRRANCATASYSGPLTVYGACGETPRTSCEVARRRSGPTAASSSAMLAAHCAGSGPNTSWYTIPRPAVADAGDRCLVKRLRARRLLQLANAADPREEFGFLVLHATTQVGELEVRVAVDETRQHLCIAKLDRLYATRGRDARVRADGGDPAVCVNKNGAVLEGRRRDGMDPASSNAEQEIGCDPNTER